MKQLEIPGQFPPCETGDAGHPYPTPLAVAEYDYGKYGKMWMCGPCLKVMER